jgi:hypothetical protein
MCATDSTAERSAADVQAIVRAATDYIESWLDGDAERMRSCLHPAPAKRRAGDAASGALGLHEVTAVDMTEDIGGPKNVERGYEVTVLDVSPETASVKVSSAPFIDHLHLARFRDRWLIVNALYERREVDRSHE